jgi:hypothetical protein
MLRNISVINLNFLKSEVVIWITYPIISIECNCWVKFTFFLRNEFLPSSEEKLMRDDVLVKAYLETNIEGFGNLWVKKYKYIYIYKYIYK